jgi:hypothetical protein
MAENKERQGPSGNQSEGMTGNDGSKGNVNTPKPPTTSLGSDEENQQRESSNQGHSSAGKKGQGALETNTGAGGSNGGTGAGSEVEG